MGTSLAAEPLLALAVTVTSEQHVESVLQRIVQGLASQPGVALARIWLRPSADLPDSWHTVSDSSDYLCLVASAGTPINSPGEDWCFLQGQFARMPFNVGKVGQVAASRNPILVKDLAAQNDWVVRPEWAKREGIRSFAGHPLIFRDKLLGVIGVFSREPLGQQEFTWLGLFANQAAVAIANARAEEAVQSSERNRAAIINTIPTTAWTARPDGYCDFLNQVWLDYAGMTAEKAQGWGWSEAIHPDDRKKLVEEWQSCLASGNPVDTEARIRHFDGCYRWFLIRANPLRDESGNILKWYGTCVDIEDRKKAEEALQSSERNLSLIINAIPALIHTARPDGYLDYFNQRWLEYLGCSLSDVEGWKWTTWIHPDELQGIVDKWRACLASGEIFEYETRVRRGDGQYRWMFHRKVPLRDEHGNIVRWYGTSLDIEDRKRAEWLRAAEMRTLQMIADNASLTDILNHLCQSIDLLVSPWITTILLMDPDGTSLRPAAGPRVPEEWVRAITPLPVAAGTGLCGTAAFLKTRVIVPDVAAEPIWLETHRGLALKNAIRAGWSQPILTQDNQVLGTLAAYSAESRLPTDEDVALIEAAGRVALIAIERQRSQEALRNALDQIQKSESRLRRVIDAIPALAWCNLPDGSNEFLNKRWHEYTGLSPEQSYGWGWQAAFHPDDLPPLMEKWLRMLTSEESDEIEARLRRHDGVYRWFLIRAEPFRDESGEIVRWYGTSTDIDDRKRAEAQVEQAYLRLSEAQRLSKTGSFITDLLADDHNWSEEAFRIFEFDPATKVTVQMVRDTIHPEDLPSFDAVIARAMAGQDVDFVFRIVTSRGAVKHIRGMARVMEQIAGRPLFIGAFQDVTESKLAEEALNKARSELAGVARVTTLTALTASIAHEVNQPLSGIMTNASTCLRMLDGYPPNVDGARETVRRTLRDGKRASDVISRLRALFSKKEFTLEPLDLNEATREVIALSLSDLQRNRVILRSELADDLPPVTGDRVQLQQVILNLLRNASDAMSTVDDRPRDLLVRTEPDEDDRVRLTVKDVGVGFTPEAAAKLFQAFYTTKNNGMGIGLHVSHSIIEGHHGRLWATANDGPGATFSFAIPCRREGMADTETRADWPGPGTNAA
ncbi:MAG TPA: PAS domain-containing protein [Terriglobales bacterium]|nr:PAS domain-containing protein [Terriglobales bacterium]